MSLENVDPPAPPELPEMDADDYEDVEVQSEDYHREDLEAFLAEGAWEAAFETWARETDLEEHGFEIARELGLFEEFDFFWDFNEMTRRLFHSKSARSSGASYSVSQST